MLVLTRNKSESIMIGDDIVITVTDVGESQIKIGIEAPKDVRILRAELLDRQRQEVKANNFFQSPSLWSSLKSLMYRLR